MSSKLTGCDGCPGHSCGLLCRLSLSEGMLGPMAVGQRLKRSVSSELLAVLAVASTI